MTSMELRKIPVAPVWRTARQTSEKIEAIHIREADNTEEYSKYIRTVTETLGGVRA